MCARVWPWILLVLVVFGICFVIFSSPYVFLRYLTAFTDRLFQGPYWSSNSRGHWWYRLFFRDDFSRHCKVKESNRYENFNSTEWWTSGDARPQDWSVDERALRTIPDYVLDYAPLIHLFSDEVYWPGDPAEHLVHTTPFANNKPLTDCASPYNLTNLDQLNKWGKDVYLKSKDNAEDKPDWLLGVKNIPHQKDGSIPEAMSGADGDQSPDKLDKHRWWSHKQKPLSRKRRQQNRLSGGRSDAPVVMLVVPKEDGIVDAFWFFFYSYNRGNYVMGIRFGDHIADWEHTVVRFKDGKPQSIFFSEHFFGEAYTWDAVEKLEGRPVGYSGVGTHAMYGTAGIHNYIAPFGLLHDETDRGPLWDPRENMQAYTYDHARDELRASTLNPAAPTAWFDFLGHWGDARYPISDPRQYRFATEYRYVPGPLGPRYKNLRRRHICQQAEDVFCDVRTERAAAAATVPAVSPEDVAEDEEMSPADERQFISHRDG